MRFAADTLNGVPSIVIGVFAYGVAVLPFRQFSALAGGLALGIMMIPIITRTTEELLLLVPGTLREGALALGATRARAVFTVVAAGGAAGHHHRHRAGARAHRRRNGAAALHRVQQPFFSTDLRQPISSLTVQVFTYAISPVRGLAPPGVGRRARAGDDRADLLAAGAVRDAAYVAVCQREVSGWRGGCGGTEDPPLRTTHSVTAAPFRRASVNRSSRTSAASAGVIGRPSRHSAKR